MNNNFIKGFSLFLLYCLTTTAMNILIKITSQSSISNVMVMFLQYILALILIFPFVMFNKKIGFKTKKFHLHLLRGLAGFGTTYCLFIAVSLISLATAILLIYSAPLWVILLSKIFFGTKISLRATIGLIIGFIGVALSVSTGLSTHVNSLGVFIAALGGFLFAVVLLVSQKLDDTDPHERVIAYYFIISIIAILLLFPSEIQLNQFEKISNLDWIYIFGIGSGQVIGLWFMLQAYQYETASKLASLNYLVIVFSAIAQYMIWKTFISKTEYLGASLIIIGLILSFNNAKSNHKELENT